MQIETLQVLRLPGHCTMLWQDVVQELQHQETLQAARNAAEAESAAAAGQESACTHQGAQFELLLGPWLVIACLSLCCTL